MVGVGVGAAPCVTVIRTVCPLPVSVISTVPVRAAPVFLVVVKVTDDPLTVTVSHIALEFLSTRSEPFCPAVIRTLFDSTPEPKVKLVTLAVIFGVGVGVAGFGVGVLVGFGVGVFVGFGLGVFVGFGVGVFVGFGVLVGFFVGVGVFVGLGFFVGVAVGFGVFVGFGLPACVIFSSHVETTPLRVSLNRILPLRWELPVLAATVTT